MIVDNNIEIKVNNKDRKYYELLGYKIPKERNGKLNILTTDLPKIACL